MQPRWGLYLPKKVAHGYSYSGAMVTLIRREWRKKNKKKNTTSSNNCTVIFAPVLNTGVMVLETIVFRVVVDRCLIVPNLSTQEQHWRGVEGMHYAVVGTDTSSRRLFLRLQDTLLPFLGTPWMNLTHTLSCLNCTRNLLYRNIIKSGWKTHITSFNLKTGWNVACSLTHLRCQRWAAPCLQWLSQCGGVWWWSQSDAHYWVRSLLWRLRLTPTAKTTMKRASKTLHQAVTKVTQR